MKRLVLLGAAMMLLATVASSAFAQSTPRRGMHLEVTASAMKMTGDDYSDYKVGVGAEAQLQLGVSPLVSVGLGVAYLGFATDLVDDAAGAISETDIGFFVEPRLALGSQSGSVRPFLLGRVGYLLSSAGDVVISGIGSTDWKATGLALGVGGGLLIAAGKQLTASVSASFNNIATGKVEVNGVQIPGSDNTGQGLNFRVGLRFQL